MKRVIIILSVTILCCATISAEQLTSAQRKAKSEIYKALKKIATNVSDVSDEAINFSANNITYQVNIGTKDYDPLYITLMASFSIPEDYDTDIVHIAAIEAASGMPVYVSCKDEVLIFDCEMYAKDAKPFIAVLLNMIKAIETSYNNFDYDKTKLEYVKKGDGHASAGVSAGIDSNDSGDIYIFPKVTSKGSDSRLYITKVTFSPQYTILDMTSYNGAEYQWCSISKNSYISVDGTRYTLKKAEGIAYSPQYTIFPNYDSGKEVSLSFKLYFPVLPPGTTNFNFSEGVDGWQLNGVELKHWKSLLINGKQIDTDAHKWNCVAVEIQDGQTVITKTVTPKKEDTIVWSSQEEYIEDAETGRRYYLMISSIGFQGSPEIIIGTEPVTFYEVYPALPSNVKKINISSGTQYYVKDLELR